uniref:HIG1 domain-containing protein n=1 Tax=Marmota marmota marmota TaxID=9994 RepID=A0A8C6EQV7_MARMA
KSGKGSSLDPNLSKKIKRLHIPTGVASFIEIATYGLYKLRTRGDTGMPVHLDHIYVAAQDFAVGAMTLGVGFSCNGNSWQNLNPRRTDVGLHIEGTCLCRK